MSPQHSEAVLSNRYVSVLVYLSVYKNCFTQDETRKIVTDHKYSWWFGGVIIAKRVKAADYWQNHEISQHWNSQYHHGLKNNEETQSVQIIWGELLGEGADYVTKQLTPDCTRRFPFSLSLHIQSWGLKKRGQNQSESVRDPEIIWWSFCWGGELAGWLYHEIFIYILTLHIITQDVNVNLVEI